MSDSESHRRDVAGRFSQATRNAVFDATHRLFPAEDAPAITELTERIVEDTGWQAEDVAVILQWFRSDDDVQWLDRFWQSPEGRRFLALNAELTMRSSIRLRNALAATAGEPQISLPPPRSID